MTSRTLLAGPPKFLLALWALKHPDHDHYLSRRKDRPAHFRALVPPHRPQAQSLAQDQRGANRSLVLVRSLEDS